MESVSASSPKKKRVPGQPASLAAKSWLRCLQKGCAFEGQGMARIGGPPATPESVISFSAAAGDGLQSGWSELRRRQASHTMDLVTWGVLKLHPAVFRHHGKPCAEGWPCRGAPCLSFTWVTENSKRASPSLFYLDCRPARTSATPGTPTCGKNNMGTLVLTP